MAFDRLLASGFDRFLAVPRTVAACLVLFGIALNFANVVGRYVFSAPIAWAEEVMIFGMIWIIFLGAVLAERDNEHLKIDLLAPMLPPPLRKAHQVVVAAIVCAVVGFTAWQSFLVTELFADLGDRSTVAGIPKWLTHGAITVGLVLIVVASVAALRAHIVDAATRRAASLSSVADPAETDRPGRG